MTASPPFADPSDIEGIWRPLSAEDAALAAAWIDQASQQVRDEVPDVDGLTVDERITAGTLAPETVRDVVARMVLRVLMNPEGARQRSHSLDDYQETVLVDSTRSSGEMFISAAEMKRLTGLQGRRAFEIDTRPDPPMLVTTVQWYNYYPWDYPP